jgi:excisionase family DNA binding protein
MVSAVVERGPIAPLESERSALSEMEYLLNARSNRGPMLVGPKGEQIELPASVFRVLRQVVHAMAQDQAVTVVPVHKQLTTQQAAEVLGVSRPYLVRLLDAGEIPYSKTGTHRRVRFDDLMNYARQRDRKRRKDLSLLTQMSQEMGLYPNE